MAATAGACSPGPPQPAQPAATRPPASRTTAVVTLPPTPPSPTDESAPPPATSTSAPAAPPPAETAAAPAPLKLTVEQAETCAVRAATALAPQPKLRHIPPWTEGARIHWFEVPVGKGRTLGIAVDDADCSAALSPSVTSDVRFDVPTAKRFVALRDKVWRVVDRDPEWKGLCKRLEALEAQHPNLLGCFAFISRFPEDLCTTPAPPPAPGSLAQDHDRLNHPCYWHVYLGEQMGTHTNRHATLVVDAGKLCRVGLLLPNGQAVLGTGPAHPGSGTP